MAGSRVHTVGTIVSVGVAGKESAVHSPLSMIYALLRTHYIRCVCCSCTIIPSSFTSLVDFVYLCGSIFYKSYNYRTNRALAITRTRTYIMNLSVSVV